MSGPQLKFNFEDNAKPCAFHTLTHLLIHWQKQVETISSVMRS